MKQRIRAAALIEKDGKLLLVEHQDKNGSKWWVPPGGGLEDEDASILECIKREVREEAGILIEVGVPLYINEFMDTTNDTRHLELFFEARLAHPHDAEFQNVGPSTSDEAILRAKWLSRSEIEGLSVFPKILKSEYWEKRTIGFTEYLGVSVESKDRKI